MSSAYVDPSALRSSNNPSGRPIGKSASFYTKSCLTGISALKTVEDLHRVRQEVFKSLARARVKGGDTTLHEINLALCEAVESMRSRVEHSEEHITKVEEKIEGKLKEQDDRIEDNAIVLEYQHVALDSLTMQAELLERIALGVSPTFLFLQYSIQF